MQIMEALKIRDNGIKSAFQDEKFSVSDKTNAVNLEKDTVNASRAQSVNARSSQGLQSPQGLKSPQGLRSAAFSIPPPDSPEFIIAKLLQESDPEEMTPLEALNLIVQWKKLLQSGIRELPLEKKPSKPVPKKEEKQEPGLFDF
jgi:hypothetical protein